MSIFQQKSILKSPTDSILDSDKLDFSPITDTVDPTSTITESLAHLHKFTASSDSFDSRLSNLLSLFLWKGEICLSAAKILAISHASTKTQLSEISMTPFMHLLWPSANKRTLLIHRQTLISEWIGQMPAVWLYVQEKYSVGKTWRTWRFVNCQQSHATGFCRLKQNCCHPFWLSCDRIFTSRTSFGQERILRRSFCWRHLPLCRSRHAVYSHVLYHLRIWTPCPGFEIILRWISLSRSIVPTTLHPSHFKRFG